MNKNAVAFFKNDVEFSQRVRRLCSSLSISLSLCSDYNTLFSSMKKKNANFIFIDTENVEFPLELLEVFKVGAVFQNQGTFVFSNRQTQFNFYPGVHLVQKKVDYDEIEKIIKSCGCWGTFENDKYNITRDKIVSLLSKFCFSRNQLGYMYLKETIELISRCHGSIRSINTYVYPQVAARFGTSVANVERNIRTAIKSAVENQRKKHIYFDVIGNKIPTNKRSISFLLEVLISNDFEDTFGSKLVSSNV